MFIAALCTIAKIWKQPKCPLIDEWIKKSCGTYTVEYYLAICDGMDEQSEKYKYHMTSLICGI